ncbi:magnesium and cobalt transport protein CorA [Streptomyces luteireticuli]|uniref:Magnesium/cobalt transporter CorA n=1 Tax=Streptomyces luteireticuli TaxID=173858 RepID=A0ABN0YTK6_9ACTN
MIVDFALYRDGRRTAAPADFSDALDLARAEGNAFLWVGLHEPTEDELSLVTSEFALHPLAVEDAVKAHQRPKLEVYTGSLFVVLKPVVYDDAADTVTTGELMLFLGDSFVVTVRHGEGSPLAGVRARLEEDPELLRRGPTAVLYAVGDAVADQYTEVAARLQDDLDELETEVFAPLGADNRNIAMRIYGFKRQVVEFRRATVPLADPVARLAGAPLPFVDDSARPFFRDVGDHLARANEAVEALDRLLTDILSAHLAQMGVQQNDDMRKISAWAAMAAVPTMIAGIYGMNFAHMPELRQPWGYPAALLLMGGVVLGLHRWFKRRGWL